MKGVKHMKRTVLSMLLVLVLLFTVMPTFAEEAEKPVITIGFSGSAASLPEGHTLDTYNYYLEAAKEYANCEIEFAWNLENDSQKVALAVANGEMPDVMIVDQANYVALLDSGMLADLTDVFEERQDTILGEVYAAFPESFEAALVKGRLMALPNTPQQYENPVLWVRQDWLDKLGLELPKTLDDLEELMRAFVEQDPDGNGEDDTIGMTVIQTVFSDYNFNNGMESIAALFGAYPRMWYMQDNGEVIYGSVMPGIRDTLELVARWYQEGLIDKEFANHTDTQFTEQMVSGKVGIAFGRGALGCNQIQNTHANDPESYWTPVLCPLDENGVYHSHTRTPVSSYLVVSKDCKNPGTVLDIVIGEYKWHWMIDQDEVGLAKRKEYDVAGTLWGVMPLHIQLERVPIAIERYNAFKQYFETGSIEGLSAQCKQFIAAWEDYVADNTKLTGWGWRYMMYDYGAVITADNIEFANPCFWGTTETMKDSWASLRSMEEEVFVKIIMGESDITAFDKFVEDWYANGGATITEEVQQFVAG